MLSQRFACERRSTVGPKVLVNQPLQIFLKGGGSIRLLHRGGWSHGGGVGLNGILTGGP